MRYPRLFCLLGLAVGLMACSKSKPSALPALDLLSIAGQDSIALILLEGEEYSGQDTLRLAEASAQDYRPDTLRYKSAWVVLEQGRKFYRYELQAGAWHRLESLDSLAMPVDSVDIRLAEYFFSGRDARGKEQSIEQPKRGKQYILAFSDLELKTLRKAEMDSLKKAFKPDAVEFVFMMLTSSDTTARNQLKRDTLSGLVFSDTLGLVSQVRQIYGLEREARVRLFRLDSASTSPIPLP